MLVQALLGQTCSETTLLVFPRGGSYTLALYKFNAHTTNPIQLKKTVLKLGKCFLLAMIVMTVDCRYKMVQAEEKNNSLKPKVAIFSRQFLSFSEHH